MQHWSGCATQHRDTATLLAKKLLWSPGKLFALLLKVMPALAPPGKTLSLAATDRKRLKGTSQVVMNRKPKMYSRLCHESRQKYTPQRALLSTKKPAQTGHVGAAAEACYTPYKSSDLVCRKEKGIYSLCRLQAECHQH